MSNAGPPRIKLERIPAFVDAVLAIVLTILVLGIEVPQDASFSGAGLRRFLDDLVADLHPYLASFSMVAAFWVQHTLMAHYFQAATRVFQWLNALWLLPVTLLPFVTELRATYPGELVVELIYAVTLVLCFGLLNALWHYAVTRRLVPDGISPDVLRAVSRRNLAGALVALVGGCVSLVEPRLGTLVVASVPLLYVSQRGVEAGWRGSQPE